MLGPIAPVAGLEFPLIVAVVPASLAELPPPPGKVEVVGACSVLAGEYYGKTGTGRSVPGTPAGHNAPLSSPPSGGSATF